MKYIFIVAIAALAISGCRDAGRDNDRPNPITVEKVVMKPSSPLQLDMWFESIPRPGAKATLHFSAVPDADFNAMEMKVSLPKTLAKAGGESQRSFKPVKGVKGELRIDCAIPDDNCHEIIATATATLPDGTKFANSCSLILNKSKLPAPPQNGKPKVNDRGEKIIEFSEK